MPSRFHFLVLSLILTLLAGCSSNTGAGKANPNLEVHGRVHLPQGLRARVVLQFLDANGGMEAYTSAEPPDGKFYIPGPPNGPGIRPGEYKVVIVDPDLKAGVPEAWQDPARTPLKVTVNAQTAKELLIGQ